MAALGVPMIVTVPTQWNRSMALPGLAGHIGRVPLLGNVIKKALGHLYLHSLPFTSHPNRRGGRAVVPELIGKIVAREVRDKVIAMLGVDTRAIEEDLRLVMGPPGAADRLIDAFLPHLKGQVQPP